MQRELQQQQTTLAGLYEGNPKRSTSRPTTELLLRAFQSITLTAAALPDRRILHLTALTPLQSQILALLGRPESIYTDLVESTNAIPA